MTHFTLPDLGEGLPEAEIVRWHVPVGDQVTVDQPWWRWKPPRPWSKCPRPATASSPRCTAQPASHRAPARRWWNSPTRARGDAGSVVGHMPAGADEFAATVVPGAEERAAHPGARRRRCRLRARWRAASASTWRGPRHRPRRTDHARRRHRRAACRRAPVPAPRAAAPPPRMRRGCRRATAPGEVQVLRSLRRAMAQSMALSRDKVMECTVFDDADIDRWTPGRRLHGARCCAPLRAGCTRRAGPQRLVRRRARRVAACSITSTSASRWTRPTACWCR